MNPTLYAKHGRAPAKKGDLDLASGLRRSESDDDRAKIRCPRCRWRPRASDLWSCRCGHAWNTFDTRGLCPSCGYQWKNTMCLSCHEWSVHEDWYERGGDGGGGGGGGGGTPSPSGRGGTG